MEREKLHRALLIALAAALFLEIAAPGAAAAAPGGNGPAPVAAEPVPAEVLAKIEEKVRDLDDPQKPFRWGTAARDLLLMRHPAATAAIAERLASDKFESRRKEAIVDAAEAAWQDAGAISKEARRDVAADAVKLLFPILGLADPAQRALRDLTIDTLTAIDEKVVEDEAKRVLAGRAGSPERAATVLERRGAARIVARRPIEVAVPILMDALRTDPAMPGDLQTTILEQLRSLTGTAFRSPKDALRWWAENGRKPVHVWLRDKLKSQEKEIEQTGQVAFALFEKYAATQSGEALLALLREALTSTAPACGTRIRSDAARRLGELGRPEAFEVLLAGIAEERDTDVLRARVDALRRAPEAEPLRGRAIEALLALADHEEKEVRLATALALGALKAHRAIPKLLERGRLPARDRDVAVAVLESLAKMGMPSDPAAAAELVDGVLDIFEKELARQPGDAGVIEAASIAAGVLAIPPGTEKETDAEERALTLLERCVKHESERVRYRAAESLGKLSAQVPANGRRQRAIAALLPVLEDPVPNVAVEAATALADMVRLAGAPPKERGDVIAALAGLLNGRAEELERAAFSGVLEILGQPIAAADLGVVREIADRMFGAGAHENLTKLLKRLPLAVPGAEDDRILHELRKTEAAALLKEKDPAAVAAYAALVRKDGATFRAPYATALLEVGDPVEGDRELATLLKEQPADRLIWWKGRLDCAVACADRIKDRTAALAIVRAILADADSPPEVRLGAEALKERIESDLSTPPGGTGESTRPPGEPPPGPAGSGGSDGGGGGTAPGPGAGGSGLDRDHSRRGELEGGFPPLEARGRLP